MFDKLLRIRYIFLIAVIFLLLNSLVFLIAGAVHCIHGYILYFENNFLPTEVSRPGLYLLKGLDDFMVSLVFLVFGLGISRLFIYHETSNENIPSWLNIHDLKGLKVLLWETILVTLVIFAVASIFDGAKLSWESLIIPAIILILSLALFLMRAEKEHDH